MIAEAEIGRKVSVLSILSAKNEGRRKSMPPKSENEKEPDDPFFLVHICCLFLGFLNIMPLFFLNTAAGYWMYKFRDPSLGDTMSSEDRTTLQSYYQPSSMAATTLPSLFVSFLLALYGHKWSAMFRTIWAFVFLAVLYIVFVLFTQIDTDSWQVGFFVMTIFLVGINSALMAMIQMSSTVLMAKLPQKYMFYFLLGQNGTFITTIIQIISLSLTDFQPTSGLLYFSSGAALIILTLLLLVFARKSKIFKYYDVEDIKEEKPETINWDEFKDMIKIIWPCQLVLGINIVTISCIHPSITTLVVSENEASETEWTEKYFTPVAVFFISEIGSLIGRAISKTIFITHSNKWWFIGLCILRFLISIPFFVFCNAQTRTLPVYFGKDWEFITANFVFGLTMGFLLNVGFMSVKLLAGKKQEAGLKIMTLTFSFFAGVTVANGLIMVKLIQM